MMSSRDVAKIAGVSQATVSRVMNSPEKVKPDTRIKVLNAMEQLNYYPDSIARSMKNGRTFNIGLIIGGLSNPFSRRQQKSSSKRQESIIATLLYVLRKKYLGKWMNRSIFLLPNAWMESLLALLVGMTQFIA